MLPVVTKLAAYHAANKLYAAGPFAVNPTPVNAKGNAAKPTPAPTPTPIATFFIFYILSIY